MKGHSNFAKIAGMSRDSAVLRFRLGGLLLGFSHLVNASTIEFFSSTLEGSGASTASVNQALFKQFGLGKVLHATDSISFSGTNGSNRRIDPSHQRHFVRNYHQGRDDLDRTSAFRSDLCRFQIASQITTRIHASRLGDLAHSEQFV